MRVDKVCELGAVLCSFIACTLLVVHLYRVPVNVRNRLFLLQVRYLSLADLFFVVSSVPSILVGGLNLHTDTLDSVCKYEVLPFNFSRHVSLWIEMHLAASAVLQFFKVQAMRPLRCALYLIWLPGLLLTLYSAFIAPWTYDPEERICVPVTFRRTADPVDIADLALCICICAGSYVTLVCGSWMQHSPRTVQSRATWRAATYLVNALLTYGPMLACYVDVKLFNNLTVFTIAWIFELLGGLFNTITYAMQSRYAPALLGRSTLVRDNPTSFRRPSFDVAFVADVEVAADNDVVNSPPPSFTQGSSFQAQCPTLSDVEGGNSRFLFIRES